jgi:hypothetical protein
MMVYSISKYIVVISTIFIVIWFSYDIYNFIITDHIVVYLLILLLPTSSLIKKSLMIPFILFINFFWVILCFAIINLVPYVMLLDTILLIIKMILNTIIY